MQPWPTIAHAVAAGAARSPYLDILTFEHEGLRETRSYRQLWDNACRIAAALSARGVTAGERVALMLQNHPEFVEAMIASAMLGAVFVPIDPRTRGERLAFMLRHCGCHGAIVGDYALGLLQPAGPDAPDVAWALVVGDSQHAGGKPEVAPMSGILAGPAPAAGVMTQDPDLPQQILYTSGTTGDPKGVVIRHGRFAVVAGQAEVVYGYRRDDRLYTGLSLTHANAQFGTLAPALYLGIPAVISRRFSKSRLWSILRDNRCTAFALLGGMATAIYSEPPQADDTDNPVRLITSAGMPPALWADFERRFGVRIAEYYGSLEGGLLMNRVGEGPIGSCGRIGPGLQCRIVDEAGREVPPGQPGEILFRPADGSPAVVEYFGDPEASRAKTEDGWLHSGDILHIDADGWAWFHHRKGGGIRRNGDFISPSSVEEVLARHPAVGDVFVYGRPSANGAPGEQDVVAAVVPADGVALDVADLFDWCRRSLERYASPSFIQVVSEIPKTASEKPLARLLVERFDQDPAAVHQQP